MADLKLTLLNEDGTDRIYPATKIDLVEDGGEFFNSVATKGLGNAGQVLIVNQQENDVEWVTPYDASTAVISPTVIQGDPNPVSGDAVYNALGSSNASNALDLSGNDFEPGLYSIDLANAVLPSDFSIVQKHFIISAEVAEEGPSSMSDSLVAHFELAINNSMQVTHRYDIDIYYTYEIDGDTASNRTFWISLWIDNVEIATHFVNGVKVRKLLKYI